ncbi:hypothetical protein PI125_g15916 [Phytophthora idaei]|nr:hypothetical protein PI125_g15916 [Phytophthora idaei]
MDETGLFYDNVPRGSMCIREAPALKQSKSRITWTNSTGSHKLPLLFIGKSKNPRWIKDKPADIDYTSTAKAWMTTVVANGPRQKDARRRQAPIASS